jgi:hypothetical protein
MLGEGTSTAGARLPSRRHHSRAEVAEPASTAAVEAPLACTPTAAPLLCPLATTPRASHLPSSWAQQRRLDEARTAGTKRQGSSPRVRPPLPALELASHVRRRCCEPHAASPIAGAQRCCGGFFYAHPSGLKRRETRQRDILSLARLRVRFAHLCLCLW